MRMTHANAILLFLCAHGAPELAENSLIVGPYFVCDGVPFLACPLLCRSTKLKFDVRHHGPFSSPVPYYSLASKVSMFTHKTLYSQSKDRFSFYSTDSALTLLSSDYSILELSPQPSSTFFRGLGRIYFLAFRFWDSGAFI